MNGHKRLIKRTTRTFWNLAENLKLDKRQFLRIESQTSIQAVKKDQELGTSLNVEATPTFFVNGQKTAAPQLFATVESLLAQKNESK
jgi:protein-disulfide isomerase